MSLPSAARESVAAAPPAAKLRRWRKAACLCLALTLGAEPALLLAQPGPLPRLGDPGGGELSPLLEHRIGEAIMRDLRRNGVVMDDAEGTDYLNSLAARLTARNGPDDQKFEFFLVGDPTLNAFALPGGFIGVHSGLIIAAQTESELASVLAHEMAHVTQRHIARMFERERQSSIFSIAALVLAVLAARSNPQAVGGIVSLGESVQMHQMLGFSRDAEREADRIGLETLGGAGFYPPDMANFFERLQKASRLYEGGAPEYLRTHPLTTNRMADIQGRVQEVAGIASKPVSAQDQLAFELLRVRLKALADPGVDGLRRARAQLESAPAQDSGIAPGLRWYGIAVIANAQRDFAGARVALARARSLLPQGQQYLARVALEVELDSGATRPALALADEAVGRWPQARSLAHLRARALLELRAYQAAADYLSESLRQWPKDPRLWKMLAEAHNGLGKDALAHRATAERYALAGAWPAAIEQLKMARTSPQLDFYTASRIDARLRELERELRREQEDSRGQRPDG